MSHSNEETAPPRKRQLVHALNPNDVILGRGQHLKNEGNARLVALVRSRVVEYNTSQEKSGKDLVARQIVQEIHDAGGRFVRKVETDEAVCESNAADTAATPAWEIVNQATVLVKIKQTFRDYSVIQRRASADSRAAANAPRPHGAHVAQPHTYGISTLRPGFFSNATAASVERPGGQPRRELPLASRHTLPGHPAATPFHPTEPNSALWHAMGALLPNEPHAHRGNHGNERVGDGGTSQPIQASQPWFHPSMNAASASPLPMDMQTLAWRQHEQQRQLAQFLEHERQKQWQQVVLARQLLALESSQPPVHPLQPAPTLHPNAQPAPMSHPNAQSAPMSLPHPNSQPPRTLVSTSHPLPPPPELLTVPTNTTSPDRGDASRGVAVATMSHTTYETKPPANGPASHGRSSP